MSQAPEVLLRNALDAVDRNRRRGYFIFGVLFVLPVGILLWATRTTDVRQLLLLDCVLVVFSVGYGVVALAIYINRMTRLLLNAINLLRTIPSPSSTTPSSSPAK